MCSVNHSNVQELMVSLLLNLQTFIHLTTVTEMTTQRFTNLFEAVDFLTANFPLSRQQATHFVWDHSFTIGTDKGVWIDTRFVKVS
jgi:hypothetical protein